MIWAILIYLFCVVLFGLIRADFTENDGALWYLVGCPGASNLFSFISLFIGGFFVLLGGLYVIGFFVR